jgi:arylsulfatase
MEADVGKETYMSERQFNVIFVTCDCLRWDHTDWDKPPEQRKGLMPNLQAFADEAVTFSNCYSQGISTSPSVASFLTSTYPLDYGKHWIIAAERKTIAEMLKAHGYRTGGFHSNPNVGRASNYHKGFDVYRDNIIPLQFSLGFEKLPRRYYRLVNKFFRLVRRQPSLPARDINRKFLAWVKNLESAPFFGWIHYMDTHGPYLSYRGFSYLDKYRQEVLYRKAAVKNPHGITEEERRRLMSNYCTEIKRLDVEIARFFRTLKDLGVLDRSLVIVFADHGEEFGDHGLFGHVNKPYDELIHVPFMMRFPKGCDVSPRTVNARVRLLDLVPTVLDFLEAPLSESIPEQLEGESLLPVIRGSRENTEFDTVFIEKEARGTDKIQIGVMSDSWKYIYDGVADTKELYNLELDRGEKNDVLNHHPELAKEFDRMATEHLTELSKRSQNINLPSLELDDEVQERLRALGYI